MIFAKEHTVQGKMAALAQVSAGVSVALDSCAVMTQHLAQKCMSVCAVMSEHLAQGCFGASRFDSGRAFLRLGTHVLGLLDGRDGSS